MALGCLSQLSYDKVDIQRVVGPPPTIAGGSELGKNRQVVGHAHVNTMIE
jgi:hypothetical protein